MCLYMYTLKSICSCLHMYQYTYMHVYTYAYIRINCQYIAGNTTRPPAGKSRISAILQRFVPLSHLARHFLACVVGKHFVILNNYLLEG